VEGSVDDERTEDRVRDHYEIERELAGRLIDSTREERRRLYHELYDELYRRVPDHPMLTRKQSAEERALAVGGQMKFLRRFLRADSTFMEIGVGDCALSFAVAERVRQVYAIDVSDESTRSRNTPANFQLVLIDGCSIQLPPGEREPGLQQPAHGTPAPRRCSRAAAFLAPSSGRSRGCRARSGGEGQHAGVAGAARWAVGRRALSPRPAPRPPGPRTPRAAS